MDHLVHLEGESSLLLEDHLLPAVRLEGRAVTAVPVPASCWRIRGVAVEPAGEARAASVVWQSLGWVVVAGCAARERSPCDGWRSGRSGRSARAGEVSIQPMRPEPLLRRGELELVEGPSTSGESGHQ